jgi:hypothetical protein
MPPDVLPSQEIVQDLLSQLEDGDFHNPHFQLARTCLRNKHVMRAVVHCCCPFNFNATLSNSGRYIKFNVPSHCLSMPSFMANNLLISMSLSASCTSLHQSPQRSLSKTSTTPLLPLALTFGLARRKCISLCTGLCKESEHIKGSHSEWSDVNSSLRVVSNSLLRKRVVSGRD